MNYLIPCNKYLFLDIIKIVYTTLIVNYIKYRTEQLAM
jgi:hypothetical protein